MTSSRRARLLAILVLCWTAPAMAAKGPYDWASIRLDYVRDERVTQLRDLLTRMRELAESAARDELVQAFFTVNKGYWEASRQGAVPDDLEDNVTAMRRHFDRHYVERYFAFYDMLFVDRSGEVFYSIRKESDLRRDLAAGHVDHPLARCIAAEPREERFVDFHDYDPSSEPAAFFVEPIKEEGALSGWLVLQCAINKINSLFSATKDMGQTGETFLVNEDGYMLTESHFRGGPTILTQHLDDRNIKPKFSEGAGRRTVTDYRGMTALTSFQVVEFMRARWLVVAKIDKDEVTTRHYAQHRRYYADRLLSRLTEWRAPAGGGAGSLAAEATHRVDMDEFLRVEGDEVAETFGVSTCCAVLAAYPGRFAYLAHVSPKDALYGGGETDLLGQITRRLENFDVYPSERREMLFVFAAPQLEALPAFLDKILAEGYFLSQARVAHDARARSAAIRYRPSDEALAVSWRFEETGPAEMKLDDTAAVDEIIEHIMASH